MTKEKYILDQVKTILKESIDNVENQMHEENLVWHNEHLLEYIEKLERGEE
jgi:hypothetical protein